VLHTQGDPASPTRPGPPTTTRLETVTVQHLGDHMQITDPDHGPLTVPTDRLLAALSARPDLLAEQLHTAQLRLTGTEPPITLAALAALHTPNLVAQTTATDQATPPAMPASAAPSPPGCATPGCGGGAETTVSAGWPTGPREITSRCRPCAARLATARLPRGCGVEITPLRPTAEPPALAPPAHPPSPQVNAL
jgi:hypothetical protein